MNKRQREERRRIVCAGGLTFAAAMTGVAPWVRAANAVDGGKLSDAATTPLVMGLLRNPVSALIAITDQRGWFKEAGVSLSTVLFAGAGGPKVIQAMGGGSIGLGSVSSTAVLLAAASRIPLRIVSISTDPAPVFALISSPDITSVAQLAGKRVATTAGTGLQYFLARILQKHGMSLKDVQFVNLPAGDAQAAFIANRVDAVVPSLTGRFYIRSIRKDARELFTYDDFARPPGPLTRFDDYDVFVAPQAVLDTQRSALRAFLLAYHGKGVPYLLNPATQNAAISAITRYVNAEQQAPIDEAAMRQQLIGSRFFDVKATADIMASDGFMTGLEDQIKFFVDSKQMPVSPSLKEIIVSDLLKR